MEQKQHLFSFWSFTQMVSLFVIFQKRALLFSFLFKLFFMALWKKNWKIKMVEEAELEIKAVKNKEKESWAN